MTSAETEMQTLGREDVHMRSLIAFLLAASLKLYGVPSQDQTPEPTYEQTSNSIVNKLTEFGGYTREDTVVTYKDVSMDGCQLRFTVSKSAGNRFTDIDTFTVLLDSIASTQWGTLNNPPRGYVMLVTTAPIRIHHRRVSHLRDHQAETTDTTTTIGSLELGRPGADYADMANKMETAIVHAADICKALTKIES